jgi:hypothetical protein
MIQVTTHLGMIVEQTNHITLNASVDNLLKAIEYADEAEGDSNVIAIVSLYGVLLQPPYTLFHWREIVDEMAAAQVLDWFEDGLGVVACWEDAK